RSASNQRDPAPHRAGASSVAGDQFDRRRCGHLCSMGDWCYATRSMAAVTDSHSGSPSASLLIRIDPRAPEGLQQQVYSAVRRAILDGVLAPGTRLPSSRTLADDVRVSRTTTLLAYE